MNETKNVEIKCPECWTDNVIPRPWELSCQECKAPLGAGIYSKRMIPAWAVLLLGIGGATGYEHFIGNERYPIRYEHTIIEACINGSRQPLKFTLTVEKRNICVCALEKTQDDFSVDDYKDKKEQKAFWNTFQANAISCLRDK